MDDLKYKGIDHKKLRFYFIDILKALYYCNYIINVIHKDIKPDNIVINNLNQAVLIDFGVSSTFDGMQDCNSKSMMGSLLYQAPELVLNFQNQVKI